MLYPYTTPLELLGLAKTHPADFAEWVALEKAKLARFAHLGEKN